MLRVLRDSNFGLAFLWCRHQRLFHILLNKQVLLAIVAMYILLLCLLDVQIDGIQGLLWSLHNMSRLNIQEYTSMPYKISITSGGRVIPLVE